MSDDDNNNGDKPVISLSLDDVLGGDKVNPDEYAQKFNATHLAEDGNAPYSKGTQDMLRKQDLFDRLKYWIEADYGTNELKRAQIIRDLVAKGYSEDSARDITKPPQSLSETDIADYMAYRDRQIFGYRDGRAGNDVEAKLYELSERLSVQQDALEV